MNLHEIRSKHTKIEPGARVRIVSGPWVREMKGQTGTIIRRPIPFRTELAIELDTTVMTPGGPVDVTSIYPDEYEYVDIID